MVSDLGSSVKKETMQSEATAAAAMNPGSNSGSSKMVSSQDDQPDGARDPPPPPPPPPPSSSKPARDLPPLSPALRRPPHEPSTPPTTGGKKTLAPLVTGDKTEDGIATPPMTPRQNLRKALSRTANALTPRERLFLEGLLEGGDSNAIACAARRLDDGNLFFDRRDETGEPSNRAEKAIQSQGKQFHLERRHSSMMRRTGIRSDDSDGEDESLMPRKSFAGKTTSFDSTVHTAETPPRGNVGPRLPFRRTKSLNHRLTTPGSKQRAAFLEDRRENNVQGSLWKAHENGIAITPSASHRSRAASILKRKFTFARTAMAIASAGSAGSKASSSPGSSQRSAPANAATPSPDSGTLPRLDDGASKTGARRRQYGSLLSTETLDLARGGGVLRDRPGEDEIFRSSVSTIDGDTLIEVSAGHGSFSGLPLKSGRTESHPAAGAMSPTGSHRSRVTFTVDTKAGSGAGIGAAEPAVGAPPLIPPTGKQSRPPRQLSRGASGGSAASSSIMSIPAIQMANPIRSNSITSASQTSSPMSVGGPPSIKIANRLPSESTLSEGPPGTGASPLEPIEVTKSNRDIAEELRGLPPHIPLPNRIDARQTSAAVSLLSFDSFLEGEKTHQPDVQTLVEEVEYDYGHYADDDDDTDADISSASRALNRKVLMRKASRGEGIEMADMNGSISQMLFLDDVEAPSRNNQRLRSMMFRSGSLSEFESSSGRLDLPSGGSFEDPNSARAPASNANLLDSELKRSISNDELLSHQGASVQSAAPKRGQGVQGGDQQNRVEEGSWDLGSNDADVGESFDAWHALTVDEGVDYGGRLPFCILGTSADDEASRPHVLSPPLMESLQNFLPYSVSESNFWMKFSMVRDGASLYTMLQHIRGAQHTLIAIESVDGEVFGSFTSQAWRKSFTFFGTGESFLWRMRKPRTTEVKSIIDQARMESEIDVYPWAGTNRLVQVCKDDMIAVGGGADVPDDDHGGDPSRNTKRVPAMELGSHLDGVEIDYEGREKEEAERECAYGFGIAVEDDLLHGTSNRCITFRSPPLSKIHRDGSPFEIGNLEVWTMTPCMTEEEAEKIELGRLFLETHSRH